MDRRAPVSFRTKSSRPTWELRRSRCTGIGRIRCRRRSIHTRRTTGQVARGAAPPHRLVEGRSLQVRSSRHRWMPCLEKGRTARDTGPWLRPRQTEPPPRQSQDAQGFVWPAFSFRPSPLGTALRVGALRLARLVFPRLDAQCSTRDPMELSAPDDATEPSVVPLLPQLPPSAGP